MSIQHFSVNISGTEEKLGSKVEEARKFLMDLFEDADFDNLEIRTFVNDGPTPYRSYYTNPGPRPRIQSASLEPDVPPIHSFANGYVFKTRDGAEAVHNTMKEVLKAYEVVSLADFKELIGFKTTYIDYKWVWTSLDGVELKQNREGWVLTLPTPLPIRSTENNDNQGE